MLANTKRYNPQTMLLLCVCFLLLHNLFELFKVYEGMIQLNYEHSNIAFESF